MWVRFENNPHGKSTGDCVVRAISKVLELPWAKAYLDLCVQGLSMSDWGSSNPVWDAYLRERGFVRKIIPNTCPDCYTILDFTADHPEGRYIVATGSHVVAVIDGNIYDSWDSSNEIPTYFYEEG